MNQYKCVHLSPSVTIAEGTIIMAVPISSKTIRVVGDVTGLLGESAPALYDGQELPIKGGVWGWELVEGEAVHLDIEINERRPNAQIRKFKCTHSERDYVPVGTVVEGEYVGGDSVFKLSRNYFSISPAFRKGYNMPINGQLFSWSSVFE